MIDKTLIIVGAGGFGREVFHWAQDQMKAGQAAFSSLKFVDDGNDLDTYPEVASCLLSSLDAYTVHPDHLIVIAIGSNKTRHDVAHRLKLQGVQFGSVIHPTAIITHNSTAEPGLIMCPNSVISTHTQIGAHTHINFGASVGHDCHIGNFVTISSHADIMGNCTLEDDVFLGSGARILPNCSVATGSTIGAGAQVQRSVKKRSTLYQAATKRM